MKSSQAVLLSVLCFAFAGTAAAQAASSGGVSAGSSSAAAPTPAPGQTAIGPAEAWAATPAGSYRVVFEMPGHWVSMDVTFKNVNGQLVANLWPVGDNDGRDFDAAVKGNELVVSGTTERGKLVLSLERHGNAISGTWQLGEEKGAITGSAK
ncbi:MAG TPA: hypothetical protein VJS39_05440 [Gemmatimonadaceae bacterium]|nr:hypothetical protein [Gemmatimonadaceae bacterium]